MTHFFVAFPVGAKEQRVVAAVDFVAVRADPSPGMLAFASWNEAADVDGPSYGLGAL